MPAGLYIHVPFCLRKCPYCDFYSNPFDKDLAQHFTDALKRDIAASSAGTPWSETTFTTLYIGGGTPTVLSAPQLQGILDQCLSTFQCEEDIECTVEANPETIEDEKLKILYDSNVNRFSLGVQSLHDDELRRLGRIHSVETALKVFEAARRVGFRNIGIDLIFAIPGQSFESWKESLHRAVALAPEHISAYNLTIEPKTVFAQDWADGKFSSFPEDQEAAMYEYAIDFLESQGYEHYEISNFARPGFRSQHNQIYWDHSPYLGLGPSAHSFFDNCRAEKVRDVHEYIRRIECGESPVGKDEILSEEKLRAEAVFLALRKREGLNVNLFRKRFGTEVDERYGDIIKKYADMGLLERDGSFLRFTRKGLMVANTICSEFMSP
ncbi:MAG: radical SAM family heme chaperone HemW [Gemmatimonadota bacterium]|nr:MAG: radical SAM family heme chaperone HemW [Gemmatimonadota bacterium]